MEKIQLVNPFKLNMQLLMCSEFHAQNQLSYILIFQMK